MASRIAALKLDSLWFNVTKVIDVVFVSLMIIGIILRSRLLPWNDAPCKVANLRRHSSKELDLFLWMNTGSSFQQAAISCSAAIALQRFTIALL